MRLSRSEGFTFGTIVVNNRDNNGVYLSGVEKPSTPTLTRYDVISPGVDGSTSYKNRYEDKKITLTVSIYKEKIEERRMVQRSITRGLLSGQDRLYFHDDPTRYHLAEVFDEVEVSEEDFFTELKFTFKCDPFIYDSDTSSKWTGITSERIVTVVNNGNFEAFPIFKIEGVATNLTISIGGKAFSLSNIKAATYVDVKNMNVYIVENGTKKSTLQTFQGIFPKIPEGSNQMKISGTGLNVSVDVQFANTYIC